MIMKKTLFQLLKTIKLRKKIQNFIHNKSYSFHLFLSKKTLIF